MINIKVNADELHKVAEKALRKEGVRRMRRVKEAAAAEDGLGPKDYQLSVEGRKRLRRKDMVTVITASAKAMEANARNNTLVKNFYHAGGA